MGCSPWGREELDMTERLPLEKEYNSTICADTDGPGGYYA